MKLNENQVKKQANVFGKVLDDLHMITKREKMMVHRTSICLVS